MEFMDLLVEWLDLRDKEKANGDLSQRDSVRRQDLEFEINKRMRGEL